MNFLAHAWLAGDDSALIVGGVVGDWIKGTLPGVLPADLARGVMLHRAIDSHAETHPAFCRSRTRISPLRRRYAGVLVDMFYDHLLAREWARRHAQPLRAFCQDIYSQIENRMGDLPEASHSALRMMVREDWLSSYSNIEGIADVLARMSRRARQPNPLQGGELEFLADAEGFEQDFHDWLEDAGAFCDQWQAIG
ncbi:MAG: ACP phosphodiesterase [Sideroxydans sp.]|nr:ACP phosphodiesterase [Sideroxydans sp.]MDD5471247.1 ACP phosphodiesterase [Sideroxydans sp.]